MQIKVLITALALAPLDESALALRGLSDVSPSAIHITVPKGFRIRREIPGRLVVHNSDLRDEEVTLFEGIPTTTVARTIEECHRAHLGPALLRQALDDAEREGDDALARGANRSSCGSFSSCASFSSRGL